VIFIFNYDEEEGWVCQWINYSIIVYNIWLDEFIFYKNRSDINSKEIQDGDLEYFEDMTKNQVVTYDDLYEMFELAEIIKERRYYCCKLSQMYITDY